MTTSGPSLGKRTSGYEFIVRHDGTVVGDDGAEGRLAASLRYVSRLADSLGEQLALGDLVGIATTSSSRLSAQLGWDMARQCIIRGRLDLTVPHQPRGVDVPRAEDVDAALARCVERVQAVGGVRWSAVVTADARIVAAHVPTPRADEIATLDDLTHVGSRVLAVRGAIPERYLSGYVHLTFEAGSLLLVPVRQSCLVVGADTVDEEAFTDAVDEVRAVLADQRLGAATTMVELPPVETGPVERAEAPAPQPPSPRRRWRRR